MKSLYRLDQFDRVLALRNRAGLPYLLIGGQAVNFWAGLYAVRESALAELKPFTSEDIDFKGDRSDVEHIAAQPKLRGVGFLLKLCPPLRASRKGERNCLH